MEGSEAQQFCLRWHNYSSSLLASLPRLLDWDDLTDVTLYAGGLSVKAHRIVLSACSQYFKAIFKELGSALHPVIVIPGADFTDLSALITFMYSGEVTVYRHQLPSLIALADTLSVEGLAHFGKNDDEPPVEQNEPCSRVNPAHCDIPSLPPLDPYQQRQHGRSKRYRPMEEWNDDIPSSPGSMADSQTCLLPSPNKMIFPGKPLSKSTVNSPLSQHNRPEDLSHKQYPSESSSIRSEVGGSSGNRTVNSCRGPSSKLYATCSVCGKQLSNQYNLRVHMETHRGARYACTSCPHVSRSRDALRKHVSYRHPPLSQLPPLATHHSKVLAGNATPGGSGGADPSGLPPYNSMDPSTS